MYYAKLYHMNHFAKSDFYVGTATSSIIQRTESFPYLSRYI